MSKKSQSRCSWAGDDALYIKYHDQEWGVPVYDDATIFEFLILEMFQAGLSWITILKKRENFAKAFDNFNPKKIQNYNETKVQELLGNSGIIRNEKKIRAAINNAARFLEIQKEYGKFSDYIWAFVDHKPIQNHWKSWRETPATSKESDAIAKDLKQRGFKFIGSTIIYAHMQATGMVNDHITDCFRYKECQKL